MRPESRRELHLYLTRARSSSLKDCGCDDAKCLQLCALLPSVAQLLTSLEYARSKINPRHVVFLTTETACTVFVAIRSGREDLEHLLKCFRN